jgi:hypothetical chaperone protein
MSTAGKITSIGIDFGTSNSAYAVARDDGTVTLAPFSRVSEPTTADTSPTLLFFPDYERDTHFGHGAIARYLHTGLEGRFVQSMKTFLPMKSFTGTAIRGRHFDIEELVATFLRRFVSAAEHSAGTTTRGHALVLGRPARFSENDDADALAEQRLRAGAERAGLADFRFLIEPVAAALAYEAQIARDETVLVADLGGGTSDFTVMRVGPSQRELRDRRPSILASRGVPVAGDKIDGEIVRVALLPSLGLGTDYLALTDRAVVPHWIFLRLLQWNHVSFLKSKETLEFLRLVHRTSSDRAAIGRLIELVDADQGYLLFRAVERAKRALATEPTARIADEAAMLVVDQPITRAQLDAAIAPLLDRIHGTALATLDAAGVTPAGVDAVFMTGGTSLLPQVRARFAATFGEDKIRGGETFTSVAVGLARAGGVDSAPAAG